MALINFDKKNKVFNLSNDKITYLMSIEDGKTLCHLYFGKKIRDYHNSLKYLRLSRSFSPNLPPSLDKTFSRDSLPKEYSSAGEGDFRTPATIVHNNDGSNSLFLIYKGYKKEAGKPKLAGLPASFVKNNIEAETLVIMLEDKYSKLEYELAYTIFKDYPVITRSVKVNNKGIETCYLNKISSLQLDFVDEKMQTITFPGAHMNERRIERSSLIQGIHVFSSMRGTSSPQMNPSICLVDKNTTEFEGRAYGFTFVYSGNHKIELEKDQINQIRLNIGINDFGFSWELKPNASFQAPEVIMTFSDSGLNKMSNNFHHFIFDHVIHSEFKQKERQILINNWEATYFDFNEKQLISLVDEAKKLGIEMFVLDDGWFGHRDNSKVSLGDWRTNKKKFPLGLQHFANYVHNKGMKFGLWFEPEMISYDSELYRKHPNYLMNIPGREPSPTRNQFVLELGRKEIRDNIFEQMTNILDKVKIDYIKWDMNRHLSDVYEKGLSPNRQGETYHRYILGLYDLMERLTAAYPNILFEGCSSGGGRFDAGIAYCMPQIWTSDNTDAIARLKIQYGTSMIFPINMMGAHVSVSPNEQDGRITPLKTRFAVAMSGDLGYELNLLNLSTEEKKNIKNEIAIYKKFRKLIQFGDFYRLKSPFDSNQAAWSFVSKDKKEVLMLGFNILADAQPAFTKTKLFGINPIYDYQDQENGQIYGGDELMELGLYDPIPKQDFITWNRYFKCVGK